MAIGICWRQSAPAASLSFGSTILSNARDNTLLGGNNTNLKGGAAINLNPAPTFVVTITIANLQAVQQKIADLEAK